VIFDYSSLLVALSFCAAGLAVTFFASWLVFRADHVLMTWALGTSVLVVSVFVYHGFIHAFSPVTGAISFSALLLGLAFFLGAGYQFRTGKLPLTLIAAVTVAASTVMAVPMFLGYDGVSYIAFNFAAAAILFATARDYWRWRAEAPLLIITLAAFYGLPGLSFALCGFVIIGQGQWVMHHAPVNWAEDVNLAMSLIGTGGIGAMSLGLNQVRLARRHKRDAETDSLTGLFNRRALYERPPTLSGPVAVVVFDIDHFKPINDIHGHQIGDTVLQTFGAVLTEHIRKDDFAARLGGEEFAVVLPNTALANAMQVAERVRQTFAAQRFVSPAGTFVNTVSAGISHIASGQADISALLQEADTALYEAKRGGRNQTRVYSSRAAETRKPVPEHGDAPRR